MDKLKEKRKALDKELGLETDEEEGDTKNNNNDNKDKQTNKQL
jgi:hypothetical protein